MLTPLSIALVATGVFAGATGTWSPCGLSMIDTLAPRAHRGRCSTTMVSCASFALGAIAGGALTFGALGLLGAALPLGRTASLTVAASVAAAAAYGEVRDVRIVPQIRRQVPEPWRRQMPLPVAAGLYGVLLGLGFTTFVLTFAVWALAAIAIALGVPWLGLAVGVGFGVGRALPVVVLAPLADRETGIRACELMAERRGLLRGLRMADGFALLLCACALGTATATARTETVHGSDPSRSNYGMAWERPGSTGMFQRARMAAAPLPGTDPALGGPYVAYRNGNTVSVARVDTRIVVRSVTVGGAQKLAVSGSWLVVRARNAHGTRLVAWSLERKARPRVVARAFATQISRPALAGNRLVFAVAGTSRSAIFERRLPRGRLITLRRSRSLQLFNPSVLGSSLLYVASGYCAQRLVLGRLAAGHERVLLDISSTARRDSGHEPGHTTQGSEPSRCPEGERAPSTRLLWTTALGPRGAYVTEAPLANPAAARIVRVRR